MGPKENLSLFSKLNDCLTYVVGVAKMKLKLSFWLGCNRNLMKKLWNSIKDPFFFLLKIYRILIASNRTLVSILGFRIKGTQDKFLLYLFS